MPSLALPRARDGGQSPHDTFATEIPLDPEGRINRAGGVHEPDPSANAEPISGLAHDLGSLLRCEDGGPVRPRRAEGREAVAFDTFEFLLDRLDRRSRPLRRCGVAAIVRHRRRREEILLITDDPPSTLRLGIVGAPAIVLRLRPRRCISEAHDREQLDRKSVV